MFGFFKKKKPTNMLEEFIYTVYGNPPPPKTAKLDEAIAITHEELLMRVVSKEAVAKLASDLNAGEIPYSTHDLALSVALNFFKQPALVPRLGDAQLAARLKAFEWMKEKKVVLPLAKTFEDDLYKLYKPGGLPPNTKEEEIEKAKVIEQGRENVFRIVFSLPFALNKLIALGKMVESGDAPLKDIIQNGGEELDEDLAVERERFYGVTLRIRELYQKRRLLLKKLKEADKKSREEVIKVLTDNRELILNEIRQLKLKDDVIVAFSDEIKEAAALMDDMHSRILSAREKAKHLGVDIGKAIPETIKNNAVITEISTLSSECSKLGKEINKIEDIFGISYEEMKKAVRVLNSWEK